MVMSGATHSFGIGRWPLVQHLASTPALALVIAEANRHPFPPRAGRIGEQHAILVVMCFASETNDAGLTHRFDQRFVERRVRPRVASIRAPGVRTPIIPVKAAHVHVYGAVRWTLNGFAFIRIHIEDTAQPPCSTVVVAADDMRLAGTARQSRLAMITWDEQSWGCSLLH